MSRPQQAKARDLRCHIKYLVRLKRKIREASTTAVTPRSAISIAIRLSEKESEIFQQGTRWRIVPMSMRISAARTARHSSARQAFGQAPARNAKDRGLSRRARSDGDARPRWCRPGGSQGDRRRPGSRPAVPRPARRPSICYCRNVPGRSAGYIVITTDGRAPRGNLSLLGRGYRSMNIGPVSPSAPATLGSPHGW